MLSFAGGKRPSEFSSLKEAVTNAPSVALYSQSPSSLRQIKMMRPQLEADLKLNQGMKRTVDKTPAGSLMHPGSMISQSGDYLSLDEPPVKIINKPVAVDNLNLTKTLHQTFQVDKNETGGEALFLKAVDDAEEDALEGPHLQTQN